MSAHCPFKASGGERSLNVIRDAEKAFGLAAIQSSLQKCPSKAIKENVKYKAQRNTLSGRCEAQTVLF